ncbi:tyrosine-type recombinase/integrase [Embleya sp. NPDC005971]|uniref:tyrosine-type recombinase/integrase n=1 Tax=Embleya sp. NPDC005971 TaxID=3156724 RepID=UPI0033D6CDD2
MRSALGRHEYPGPQADRRQAVGGRRLGGLRGRPQDRGRRANRQIRRQRCRRPRSTAEPAGAGSGSLGRRLGGNRKGLHPGERRVAAPLHRQRSFPRTDGGGRPAPTRLHDLRHLAATLAHAAGASIRDIQELLGHSSISVTESTSRCSRRPRNSSPPQW